jgi:S-adenosylmethionine:tRNA ribosyltransferase-isomerase
LCPSPARKTGTRIQTSAVRGQEPEVGNDQKAASNVRRPDDPVRLSDYDYELPRELIAQVPAAERDAARLLVLDRTGRGLEHSFVRALPDFLRAGDLLIFNDTRVRPARLRGHTVRGGKVELLLIRECHFPAVRDHVSAGRPPDDEPPKTGGEQRGSAWQCLGKPVRRLRPGARLLFPDTTEAWVRTVLGDGQYVVEFEPSVRVDDLLARHGEVPLPPYIRRPEGTTPLDRDRYQTVFAAREGAVAAPTAGLHFTSALFDALRARRVETAWLTLHVGPGTFLPVRHDDVREHNMDSEWAFLPAETVATIRRAKREGHRVIAVGTTTTRALESAAQVHGCIRAGAFEADVFIVPGFTFQVVDALITNFHLPRSTLLLLVTAFAGRERVLTAYETAVRERYRFYSYGDAMLIL